MAVNFKGMNKKNMSDDAKLAIMGMPWDKNDPKKKPSLKIRIPNSAGNPNTKHDHPPTVGAWFTVYYNNPENTPKVDIKIDVRRMQTFLCMLEDVVSGVRTTPLGMEITGYSEHSDGKAGFVGSAHIGRNSAEEVCLSIKAPGKPTVKFPITIDFWWKFTDGEGAALDRKLASEYVTRGWIKTISPLLIMLANEVYTEKEVIYRKHQKESGGSTPSHGNKSSSSSKANDDDDQPDVYEDFD